MLQKSTIPLLPGQELAQDKLVGTLLWAGYARSQQVEGTCQFAVRGGILDIYPLTEELPVRSAYIICVF